MEKKIVTTVICLVQCSNLKCKIAFAWVEDVFLMRQYTFGPTPGIESPGVWIQPYVNWLFFEMHRRRLLSNAEFFSSLKATLGSYLFTSLSQGLTDRNSRELQQTVTPSWLMHEEAWWTRASPMCLGRCWKSMPRHFHGMSWTVIHWPSADHEHRWLSRALDNVMEERSINGY